MNEVPITVKRVWIVLDEKYQGTPITLIFHHLRGSELMLLREPVTRDFKYCQHQGVRSSPGKKGRSS